MAHQKTFFADLTKNKFVFFFIIHSYQVAIVVLVIVTFQFDNLREKRSVPLTKESGIACLKNSCGALVEHYCFMAYSSFLAV